MRRPRQHPLIIALVLLTYLLVTVSRATAGGAGEPMGRNVEHATTAEMEETRDEEPLRGDGSAVRERELLSGESIPPVRGFRTDWSRTTIPASAIISGGPPKDGIPAIDRPRFLPGSDVNWLSADEPVFVVSAGGETRIYPLQILTFHEIVNDVVGGVPVAVTYCPLCNTGIAFRREFDGLILDFGTTGRLRYSNLLMYDRQTESWWQQATGEGVVGTYAGYRLELHPLLMLPWDVASVRFPDAEVLSRDTGHDRSYGRNPYTGYDTATRPFLYDGPAVDGTYNPMTRVVQVVVGDKTRAVPYPVVREERVVQFELGGEAVVVFWEAGTASGLDSSQIAAGRDVGSANAFRATAGGEVLTFEWDTATGAIRDRATGSRWDAAGYATEGPLAGSSLEPIVGIQHFWFSYSAFATDSVFEPTGE